LSTVTQTTLLSRGNFEVVGLFAFKLIGTPILAVGLLVMPGAWVAGWLPTKCAMPYKLMTLLGEDYRRAGAVYASTPRDPNEQRLVDWRYMWRVEMERSTVMRLVDHRSLAAVEPNSVPDYFWNQFPVWWPKHASSSAYFYKTAGWEPNARGEDDLNFLMMYDEHEGVAYFWVKDNV
jgi:hypothetical protein